MVRATAACHFLTSQRPKWLRHRQLFSIFTCKCASLHSRAFLNIETSKSGPRLWCFVHFDLKTCFAPQRRAIFGHRNFNKCSDTVSFLAFSLPNVLFATAACPFWTSELQKVLRHCQFFSIFTHFSPVCGTATSAPAALANLLFEQQEPRIIEKTQRFATSLTFFAHVPSF